MTVKIDGTNTVANPAFTGADTDTGLQCGTNELKLVTGGTAQATVDSAGRLLVGTTSTSATCTSVFAGRSDGANDPVLRLEVNSTAPANGSALGGLNFASSGLSGFEAGARIAAVRDGGTWTNGSSHPSYIEFATTANGASSPTERMRITSGGRLTGDAVAIQQVFTLLYGRLESHGGCSSGGPSGTFTYFDSNERAFTTVSRTTTSAPTNYSFIGDNNGSAFTFFVGCGDNPVFSTSDKNSDAATFRSWVCVHNSFSASLLGLPINATRTSLP